MKVKNLILSMFLVLFLVGCGGDNGETPALNDTNTTVDENSSQVVDNTDNTIDTNGTISLSFANGIFSKDLTKNGEVVTVEVKAFDVDNSPLEEGNITIAYPDKTVTGIDIGSFNSGTVPLVNGRASFTYTAPANLQERVDAGDTSTVFGFYLESEPAIHESFTFNYVPEPNQIVLTDYELKQNISTDTFSMNLQSSIQTSFYVSDDKGNVLADSDVASIQVTLNDTSLAILEDTYGTTGTQLTFIDKNNVSMNIKSSTKSGTLPMTVTVNFTDNNGNARTLTKVFNLTIFSGPPTAMSISYASTDQNATSAKFIEKMNVALTDSYNNLVNTNPAFSASVISGYAYDKTGPLNYMYQRADSPIAGTLTTDNKFQVASGKVTKVQMTSSGSGYLIAPTVSLAGGDGNFAAEAVLNTTGGITDITLIDQGSGYSTEPTVSATGQGYGFVGRANLTTTGSFKSILLDNAGQDYTTTPSISTDGTGTGFDAQVILEATAQVKSITINNGGSGFAIGDDIQIDGDGTGASAKVANVDGAGAITEVYIGNKGTGYTSASIFGTFGTGTGADLTVTLGKKIASIELLNGGTGYASNTLTVTGDGSGASVSGQLSYGVQSVTVLSAGSGYVSPTIYIEGDGEDAYAVGTVKFGVNYVNITNGGSGYSDAALTFTSNDAGSGAAGEALVFDGADLGAVDENNYELALFGEDYVYNASGYFDFTHVNALNDYELVIENTYEGNTTANLGFAIGNNNRQDPCISGREWTSRVDLPNGMVFDANGFAQLDIVYDYYMVAKDVVVMVNLIGQQNDLNTTTRFGEAVKHTLRGHGIHTGVDSVSFPKGTSYGTARVEVFLDDTVEALRNARFTFNLKVAGEGAIVHSVDTSMDDGILACGTDTDGTKLEGRAYIDLVVSAPVKDVTVSFENIQIVREFN